MQQKNVILSREIYMVFDMSAENPYEHKCAYTGCRKFCRIHKCYCFVDQKE